MDLRYLYVWRTSQFTFLCNVRYFHGSFDNWTSSFIFDLIISELEMFVAKRAFKKSNLQTESLSLCTCALWLSNFIIFQLLSYSFYILFFIFYLSYTWMARPIMITTMSLFMTIVAQNQIISYPICYYHSHNLLLLP